jgi:sortase A
LPGQAGVAVLFGRAHLFGAPFGEIASAHRGDRITVTTGQGVAHYLVTGVRRAGDPQPAPPAAGKGRLILVTSDGSGWRSGWAADRAVYVDADLEGSAFPTPGGRPVAVPKSEQLMQGDPAALYSLVFWLPLLGIVGVGVVWLRHRWGGWQTWLVSAPVVLAVLWAVTRDTVRLLPNLL